MKHIQRVQAVVNFMHWQVFKYKAHMYKSAEAHSFRKVAKKCTKTSPERFELSPDLSDALSKGAP